MNTSIYSTCADFNAFAKGDRADARVLADTADLTAVISFVAIGLLLTAAFFTLGFGTQILLTLAASG